MGVEGDGAAGRSRRALPLDEALAARREQKQHEVPMSLHKFFSVGLFALMSACDGPDEEVAFADPASEETALEVVDNLRMAGYPDAEIEVREDGSVLVGGDAVVSLEASREMVGADAAHDDEHVEFRQYRTTNLMSTAIDRVCVNGSVLFGTASTALDEALANFTDLGLTFDMVRTSGPAPDCDALITISYWNGTSAEAGFPAGGFPFTSVKLGDDIAPSYGLAVTTHVLTHELGHTVGLRHSDYYDRSISCGGAATNEGSGDYGVILIPGTPSTASANGSVMNSCYNGGNTGNWAANDVTALTALYSTATVPAWTSPIGKHSDACYGAYDITWPRTAGASEYKLYRSLSSGFGSPTLIYSGTALSEGVLVTSGTWYFRARACNSVGCSGWSTQVSATKLNYCN